MEYICDAPGGMAWFRLESEADAVQESALMEHGVADRFQRERIRAMRRYRSRTGDFIERNMGLMRFMRLSMPIFLSLRDGTGRARVTVMLSHGSPEHPKPEFIVVGRANSDPYPQHGPAIDALADRLGLDLGHARCFPFARRHPAAPSYPAV